MVSVLFIKQAMFDTVQKFLADHCCSYGNYFISVIVILHYFECDLSIFMNHLANALANFSTRGKAISLL